mgnify:CR=1 FL=1
MRILCVAPYFYPKPGGLERYAYEICRRLGERHEVKVICSGEKFSVENIENMEVLRLPINLRISNTPISFNLPREYKKLVEWCDIVYAHTPVPYFFDVAAAFKKKPLAVVYHSGEISGSGVVGLLARLYRLVEKKTISKADVTIGVSKFVQKRMKTDYVVEPGVDSEFFKPSNQKEDFILFVGQLSRGHKWKGLDLLLKAAAITKQKLVVVGDGELRNYYASVSRKLGVKVVFKGRIEDLELKNYYSKAKALVLPSELDKESFGIALLEANSSGTAVIGTKVGGVPYYIRDCKNGLLCKPNVHSLVNALLRDVKEFRRMGRVGRRVAERYSWDVAAEKTERILGDLVKV